MRTLETDKAKTKTEAKPLSKQDVKLVKGEDLPKEKPKEKEKKPKDDEKQFKDEYEMEAHKIR